MAKLGGKLTDNSTSKLAAIDAEVIAKKAFPKTTSKAVGYWLIGSAASVFGIVIFGGLTRLTESGYVT
jgi:heme a synthase